MPRQSRRPGYLKCGKMVVSDAAKALAMAKYLKTLVNVEIKNHDSEATATARSTTPTIVNLTSIAQGDTTITRDGSQCKIIEIDLRYFVNQNASATNTQLRVILVVDKQTNQAIYTADDLLDESSAGDAIVSPFNLDNKRRFTILYDRVHTYSATGKTNSYHKYKKKCGYMIRYDAAAAAITSNTENSLSLFFVSSEATNTPTVTHFCRLRFVDN